MLGSYTLAGVLGKGGKPPPPKSRDVYVYFDNDAEGRAPLDAAELT